MHFNQDPQEAGTLLATALQYYDAGLSVIPLRSSASIVACSYHLPLFSNSSVTIAAKPWVMKPNRTPRLNDDDDDDDASFLLLLLIVVHMTTTTISLPAVACTRSNSRFRFFQYLQKE
jgi:hypothetical protein